MVAANQIKSEMMSAYSAGNFISAEEMAVEVIRKNESEPLPWVVLGNIYLAKDALEDAETAFRCYIELAPKSADAYLALASVYARKNESANAFILYQKAAELDPECREAVIGCFCCSGSSDNESRAYALVADYLIRNPEDHELHWSLGNYHADKAETNLAMPYYLAAVAAAPDRVEYQINFASFMFASGSYSAALKFYSQILDEDPENQIARFGKATCLHKLQAYVEAIAEYEYLIAEDPTHAKALGQLSHCYMVVKENTKSLRALEQALQLDPTDTGTHTMIAYQKRLLCDWRCNSHDVASLLSENGTKITASPFATMALVDEPSVQYRSAANHAESMASGSHCEALNTNRPKLRVGFFGSDFYDHATMFLMLGVFREYDRSAFEVFVYSWSPVNSGEYRELTEKYVDRFIDVAGESDDIILERARADELDVAIDLKGFTMGARAELFSKRVAPTQINYLGFPGTMAMPNMDFIMADKFVIHPDYRDSYQEKILELPNCYQPTDNKRDFLPDTQSREAHGLPADGFVFCCFNNSYKISPAEFKIWMRLLREVPGSVLWLIDGGSEVKANLRAQAAMAGVDFDRLVFAPRVEHQAHLARHVHADLFLDTFNYNAHTTASDALWAGLPLISMPGKQFSARVCGSILSAAGLDELIAANEEDYFDLALDIAMNPKKLRDWKREVNLAKKTSKLFDTEQYTADFFQQVSEAHGSNLKTTSTEA